MVYAIHPIYEGDEIYVPYDGDFGERWTGDDSIKSAMVAYYAELEEEKRRVKAREKKLRDTRMARRDGTKSRTQAGVLPVDKGSNSSRGRSQ